METKEITMKTVADRIRLKRRMLECAIAKHQRVIDDFRAGIKELTGDDATADNEDSVYAQSGLKVEVADRARQLTDQLRFAIEEMNTLYGLFTRCSMLYEQIELGCVVMTDKRTFFISASIERFDVDGMEVFGISVWSPLYKAMEGMAAGARFTYDNKETYLIEEVF